jgi:hypothetical protein
MSTPTCQRCGLPSPARPPFDTCWACDALEDPAASERMWRAGLEDLAARGLSLETWIAARDRGAYPLRHRQHRDALRRLAAAGH